MGPHRQRCGGSGVGARTHHGAGGSVRRLASSGVRDRSRRVNKARARQAERVKARCPPPTTNNSSEGVNAQACVSSQQSSSPAVHSSRVLASAKSFAARGAGQLEYGS